MTVEIPLTRGKVAVIDDEDFELISRYRWRAHLIRGTWYAYAITESDKSLAMHRLVMRARPGEQTDHRNGDGLNNRRGNLRRATTSQNQQNRLRLSTNTSGYRGVRQRSDCAKWEAFIKQMGRQHYLGLFGSAEEAARAYDDKARELFGDYARPNFPEE